jgi:hypothetical protein
METVEVYFSPNSIRNGAVGCWKARLASNHGVWDTGKDVDAAIQNLIVTAQSFGLLLDGRYQVDRVSYIN